MCTNPIKIYNRSRRFRKGIDKPILIVPCGHCEECQQKKINDWFFRASAEFGRVKASGGFVWFPTLTYNDGALPQWCDKENNYYIPIFDPNHFVGFRNKLRVYLSRNGYNCKGDNTIRYFYACEYGGKYGRPHLHCLLFVPFKIDYNLFANLVEKAWIHGFVMYSKKGRTVQSIKGIKYVMKYIHKDCHYFDKYNVDEYLQLLKDKLFKAKDCIFKDIYRNKLNNFRRHMPHHHQSMGFGSSFNLSDDDFIKGKISSSRLKIYDNTFEYSIPMYYKRKFLYDFDNVNNIYNINPRGIHIKQEQFDVMLKKLDAYYQSVVYSNVVEDICKQKYPFLLKYNQFNLFKSLSNFDTKDIAIYSLVFSGLPIKKNVYDTMYNDIRNDFNEFLSMMDDLSYRYWKVRIDNLDTPLVVDYKDNGVYESLKYHTFDDLPVYKVFRGGLDFLEKFELFLGRDKNNHSLQEYYNQSCQFGKLFGKTI